MLTRPRAPRDLTWWFAISLAAGVSEELVYRGMMPALLLPYTRNWWTAIAISAVIFATSHANQGWPGVIAVGMLAFALAPSSLAHRLAYFSAWPHTSSTISSPASFVSAWEGKSRRAEEIQRSS